MSAKKPPDVWRVRAMMVCEKVARATGLEPATSGVTGRHSNQLSYARAWTGGLYDPADEGGISERPMSVKPRSVA
jgi:hypothetical protein